MDSNFQFRDAPPTAWAPSLGGEWAPRAAENRSIGFAEADDCRDDTVAPTVDRPQTRTKPRNRYLSRAELKVRIHSPPAKSLLRTLNLGLSQSRGSPSETPPGPGAWPRSASCHRLGRPRSSAQKQAKQTTSPARATASTTHSDHPGPHIRLPNGR